MKILIFLVSAFTVFNLPAQVASEAVFTVKKNTPKDTLNSINRDRSKFDETNFMSILSDTIIIEKIPKKENRHEVQARYYYRGQRTEGKNNVPDYVLIEKLNDVLSFCKQGINADTVTEPYSTLKYDRKKDTVYAAIQKGNLAEKKAVFIRNKMALSSPVSLHSLLSGTSIYNDKQIYYVSKGNKVNADGKSYTCIKLVGTSPEVITERKRESIGTVATNGSGRKIKVNTVHIYYLRESDYLPIKIQSANSVKKFSPTDNHIATGTAWELYKAIE